MAETSRKGLLPIQCVHSLLGDREDIDALASLSSARILLASDTHGAKDILLSVIREKGEECDAFVFCGDGVQDVLYCINCAIHGGVKMPRVVAFVGGNNDYDIYPFNTERGQAGSGEYKITVPNRQVLLIAGHTLFITHGNREGVRSYDASPLMAEARIAGADVVLFGHTHIAEADGNIINPGSLKYPRDGGERSFAVLELQKGKDVEVTFYNVLATMKGLVCRAYIPKAQVYWR